MTPQKSASQVATHSCRRVACRVISATTFCSIGALALVPGIYAKRAERISYNEFVLHHFDALGGKAYRIVVNRWIHCRPEFQLLEPASPGARARAIPSGQFS